MRRYLCSVLHLREMQGSMEERIMEMVMKRRGDSKPADEAGPSSSSYVCSLYEDDSDNPYTHLFGHRRRYGMVKVAQQDVAGSIATDRQNLKLAELQLLFQVQRVLRCRPLAEVAQQFLSLVYFLPRCWQDLQLTQA